MRDFACVPLVSLKESMNSLRWLELQDRISNAGTRFAIEDGLSRVFSQQVDLARQPITATLHKLLCS